MKYLSAWNRRDVNWNLTNKKGFGIVPDLGAQPGGLRDTAERFSRNKP